MISLTDKKTGKRFKLNPCSILSMHKAIGGTVIDNGKGKRKVKEKLSIVRAKRDAGMEMIASNI